MVVSLPHGLLYLHVGQCILTGGILLGILSGPDLYPELVLLPCNFVATKVTLRAVLVQVFSWVLLSFLSSLCLPPVSLTNPLGTPPRKTG